LVDIAESQFADPASAERQDQVVESTCLDLDILQNQLFKVARYLFIEQRD
jgi:hypothetical protein